MATCSAQAPPSAPFVRQRMSGDRSQQQWLAALAVMQHCNMVARRGQSRRSRATGRRRARILNRDVSLMMIRREVPSLAAFGVRIASASSFSSRSLLEGEIANGESLHIVASDTGTHPLDLEPRPQGTGGGTAGRGETPHRNL